MVRLDAVAERKAPPYLTEAWHLHREHLLALRIVQVVKEEVEVQVVLDLAHDAVERQEAVGANPEEDAVILDDGRGREDRRLRADGVELEHRRAADVGAANETVGRPEQAGRAVAGAAAQWHRLDDLLTSDVGVARARAGEVRRGVWHGPRRVAIVAECERVRRQ